MFIFLIFTVPGKTYRLNGPALGISYDFAVLKGFRLIAEYDAKRFLCRFPLPGDTSIDATGNAAGRAILFGRVHLSDSA